MNQDTLIRDRYRELVDLAVDGILLGSHEGIITEANEYMCSLIGMPREKILGRHISCVPFCPESMEKNPWRFDLLQKGEIVVSERNILRPDGSRIAVEMRTKMMPDGTYHSIYRDITLRKKTEEALRESEEKYRFFIQETHEGVSLIDENGVVIIWNRMMEKITGIPLTEAIGGYQWDLMYKMFPPEKRNPEHLNSIKVKILNSLETGIPPFNGPMLIKSVRNDSEEFFIEQTVFPIKTSKGFQFGSINRDITQSRKLMEHAFQSQKLESLGILAGGIAHDFNNLLAGIYGYIDLAISNTSDSDTAEYLKRSISTIERASGLTRQLLTFAKGGAPAKKVEKLFPFLKETALFALSGSNVSCDIEYPDDLPSCNFDRSQLSQVVENIIINAQQAMPDGGTIKLSACNVIIGRNGHQVLPEGKYVRISIKDSGTGIHNSILPRIFDPFFTTKEKGHGLGLATCYSIMKRHNGCIDVESGTGHGSTFHAYLPAAEIELLPEEISSFSRHTGRGKIVVVDDEEIIRTILCKMLALLGYEPVCMESGEKAVEFFIQEKTAGKKIKAMFFDLTIPGGKGGRESVSEIRNICLETPVFVVSGYAEDPVMSNPKEYGFTASICKPFTMTDLEKMLNENLK